MKHKRRILAVKKRHCIKNIILAAKNRRIVFLSASYCGSVHDKTIADEQDFQFEQVITLLQDTGFQGYAPKNAIIVQPMKKPKGKELTNQQKNKILKNLKNVFM